METNLSAGQSRSMPPQHSKLKVKLETLKAKLEEPLSAYSAAYTIADDANPASAEKAYEAAELAAYYAHSAYNAYTTAIQAYNTAIQYEQTKRKENK